MAIYTAVDLQHFGGVIPLLVEPLGESQDVTGAKLDTISAPFAAVLDDMYDAFGDVDDMGIQGYAPELHGICPYLLSAAIKKRPTLLNGVPNCLSHGYTGYQAGGLLNGVAPVSFFGQVHTSRPSNTLFLIMHQVVFRSDDFQVETLLYFWTGYLGVNFLSHGGHTRDWPERQEIDVDWGWQYDLNAWCINQLMVLSRGFLGGIDSLS